MTNMNATHSALTFSLAALRKATLAAVLLGSTMLVVVGPAHASDMAQPAQATVFADAGEGAAFRVSANGDAGEGATFRVSSNGDAGEGATFRVSSNGDAGEGATFRVSSNGDAGEGATFRVSSNGDAGEGAARAV